MRSPSRLVSLRFPFAFRCSVVSIAVAVVAAFGAFAPAKLHAQFCADPNPCAPPSIQVVLSAHATSQPTITLTIYASDDNGLATGSWQVWDNGVPVSGWLTGKIDNPGGLDQTLTATGTYGSMTAGKHVIRSRICEPGGGARCVEDTDSVTYTPPAAPQPQAAPIATLAQRNDARLLDACATCASGTASYSTPAFFFNGTGVSTTLYYSTELALPTGFVEMDVTVPASTTPSRLSVQLRNASGVAVTLSNGAQEAFVLGTAAPVRLAAQFTDAALATGVYTYSAHVTAFWPGNVVAPTKDTIPGIRVLIQRATTSPYGRGWVVAGDERIHAQGDSSSLLLADGAGGLAYYALQSCGGAPQFVCTYTAPKGDYSTLTRLTRASDGMRIWQRTDRSGAKTVWTATGLMESQVSVLGDSTTVERMPTGDVSRVARFRYRTQVGSTPIIKYVTFAYGNAGGTLSRITLPDNRHSDFVIGPDSLLTRITDPDGKRALTASYTSGRLVALAGRDTASTTFEYDAFGQLKAVVSPAVLIDGGTTARERTTITSLRHRLLDSLGTTEAGFARAATSLASALTDVVNPRGTRSSVWAHESGAAAKTETKTAAGQSEISELTYDADYRPILQTGTGSAGQEFGWSGPLLVRSQELLTGKLTQYFYSTLDRIDSVRVAGVTQLRHFYTGAGVLPDSTRSDTANVTRFTYDNRGRILTVRDANNTTVTTTYETSHANPATVVRTASGVATSSVSMTYDASGRPETTTDPLARLFTTYRDALNRDTLAIGPLATKTRQAYDDSAGVYTVTDAMGQSYSTVLNARGWVTRQQDPRVKSDSVRYDTLGRVTKSWSRRGDLVRFTYDDFDRPIMRIATVPSGAADTTTFAYDPGKRWWAVKNAESVDSFFVDAGGRPTQAVSWRASKRFRIGYGYTQSDLIDQMTITRDSGSMNVWTATTGMGYDQARRGYQVLDFGGKLSKTLVDRSGRRISDSLPTGTTPSNVVQRWTSYSAASQIVYEGFTTGASSVLNRSYDMYDAIDRLGTIARPTLAQPVVRFHEYDALGRLKTYRDERTTTWVEYFQIPNDPYDDCPGCFILDSIVHVVPVVDRSASYAYDSVANRTGAGITNAVGNRVTAMDGWTITYDDAGFMTQRVKGAEVLAYTWNALGQLVQVTSSIPAYTVTYGYDGLGRRVRKTVNGVATRYVVEGDRVLIEVDNTWAPVAKYSYYPGVDRPQGMVRNNKRYYFVQDVQGNVTALIDSAGAVTQQYEYTPYGEEIAAGSTPVANPYRYKGREWDAEARLYYMRARYYDPQLGRFISEDPIGLAGGSNPMAFVGGDPVNRRDPSGTICTFVREMYEQGGSLWFSPWRVKEGTTCTWDDFFGTGSWADRPYPMLRDEYCPEKNALCYPAFGQTFRLAVPTSGSPGLLSSTCGMTRSGGKKFHSGVDAALEDLMPIFAPADATVTVGYGKDSGYNALLSLQNGLTIQFLHLDASLLARGRRSFRVKAGNLIGLAASTGNAPGNRERHTHITTRLNGVRYDPREFFQEGAPGPSTGVCSASP